ncbi:MAG: hypothetical protein JXR53_00715 [Bacteroidales bacterium]|nr:hypothetical protein [Bacteroidales bacterium]
MRIFILVLGGILCSGFANAQMRTAPTAEMQGIESIIGVVTEKPNDFYKVVNLLEYTEGIEVVDYCFQDKLINLKFNPMQFKEEAEVFDLITSYYVDAQCFRKTMSKEVYNKQCKNEVVKQKMK